MLLALGCKKDSTLQETPKLYYFKASMNGKESEFNVDMSARVTNSNSAHGLRCVITGTQNLPGDTSRITFAFISYKSYTVSPATYPNNDIDLLAIYQRSSFKDKFYTNYYHHTIKFTPVIEEMAGTYIAGFFNGTAFDLLKPAGSYTLNRWYI